MTIKKRSSIPLLENIAINTECSYVFEDSFEEKNNLTATLPSRSSQIKRCMKTQSAKSFIMFRDYASMQTTGPGERRVYHTCVPRDSD